MFIRRQKTSDLRSRIYVFPYKITSIIKEPPRYWRPGGYPIETFIDESMDFCGVSTKMEDFLSSLPSLDIERIDFSHNESSDSIFVKLNDENEDVWITIEETLRLAFCIEVH